MFRLLLITFLLSLSLNAFSGDRRSMFISHRYERKCVKVKEGRFISVILNNDDIYSGNFFIIDDSSFVIEEKVLKIGNVKSVYGIGTKVKAIGNSILAVSAIGGVLTIVTFNSWTKSASFSDFFSRLFLGVGSIVGTSILFVVGHSVKHSNNLKIFNTVNYSFSFTECQPIISV